MTIPGTYHKSDPCDDPAVLAAIDRLFAPVKTVDAFIDEMHRAAEEAGCRISDIANDDVQALNALMRAHWAEDNRIIERLREAYVPLPPEWMCVECLAADKDKQRRYGAGWAERSPRSCTAGRAKSPPPKRRSKRLSDGRTPIEALPLFATDTQLGEALLGRERVQEWQQLAPLLEIRGLPKIDQMMGGRFVPAVRAFFMQQYGLGKNTALAPDGVEDFETWKRKK